MLIRRSGIGSVRVINPVSDSAANKSYIPKESCELTLGENGVVLPEEKAIA